MTVLIGHVFCPLALADDNTPEIHHWQFTFGGGPVWKPKYPGSDRHKTVFEPNAEILYDDGAFYASLQDGVGVNPFADGKSYAGAGFGYETGRQVRDDRKNLQGTDNVADSVTANIHGHYETQAGYYAEAAVNAGLNGDYGAVAAASLGFEKDITPDFSVDIVARADYGDARHMDNNFGVTSREHVASGLPSYKASAGFQDVLARGEADYMISPFAYIAATAQITQLTGAARNSPLDKKSLAPEAGISLNYTFK
jgi:MipA family protein